MELATAAPKTACSPTFETLPLILLLTVIVLSTYRVYSSKSHASSKPIAFFIGIPIHKYTEGHCGVNMLNGVRPSADEE